MRTSALGSESEGSGALSLRIQKHTKDKMVPIQLRQNGIIADLCWNPEREVCTRPWQNIEPA
eukprot:scaffold252077_cov17-Tisochrysis_lutea.AAC.2